MASIVQQHPTAGSEESAARQFWREKMDRHPNIAGLLAIASEVTGFFLNGHFIVALARWVIRVSGYVAESALLFAVLWISATSVAPSLIELFINEQLMLHLIWLALITLALIPEVILGNAIINAAVRWLSVVRDRHNVMTWTWAIAFTIPTLLFLILTALTLNALASAGGNFIQASAGLVGLRCFAGWSYGLLELVYAGIGRRTLNQDQPIITPAQPGQQPRHPLQAPRHPVQDERIDRLTDQVTQLASVVTQINQTVLNITQTNQYVQAPTAQPGQIAANVHAVRISMDRVDKPAPLLELLNQMAQDMPLLPESVQTIDESVQPDEQANDAPQEDASVVYPVVPGIAEDVVKLVIDERRKGTAWSKIAERTSKNYTRTVKPIKEAWTTCTSDIDTSKR